MSLEAEQLLAQYASQSDTAEVIIVNDVTLHVVRDERHVVVAAVNKVACKQA